MTVPANQNFDNISGTLGAGSATIDGVTYFSNNPNAVLSSVSSSFGNALSVDGDHLGFKSADGSAFSLQSIIIENPFGSCFFQGYRDGVLVASTSEFFSTPVQSPVTFGSDFSYIDEFRLIDPSSLSIIVDNLNFSAPVVTHLAPSLSNLSGDAASFTEGAPPVLIDVGQDAVISDPDTFRFNGGSLSVAIVANNVAAEDVLGVLTGSGVSLSGPLANGVTVFVGATAIGTVSSDGSHGNPLTFAFNDNATSADVSALLHALTYTNTNPGNPDTHTRTLQTTFSDGDGQSTTVSSTVSVTGVDNAPVAVASAGSASYTEGAPVAVDAGIVLSDVDSANLVSATIKITGNDHAGDVLLFQAQHGITGVFDAPSGALTLTGSASVADYQTALASIDFSSGNDPGSLTRSVTFTVNDGALDSAPVTRTIDVTPVNTAPVAEIAPASYAATGQVSLSLKNNGLSVSDPDAHSGTGTVTLSVGEGALTVTAGGSGTAVLNSGTASVTVSGTLAQIDALLSTDATSTVSYIDTNLVPAASTLLTLSVDDNGNSGIGGALTASDDATIFITAVNSAPVLAGVATDVAFAQHGAAVRLSPGLTVSDIDSTTLAGASVHIAGGTFTGDGDVLAAVTAGTGITASYSAVSETLTLSGTDTLAHYAQVLDTVTFQSTSVDATGAGAHPARTVEWQLDDGVASNNHSAVATTMIAISRPAATNDFNGDGTSDILWQNADGTAAAWSVKGLTLQSGANVGTNPGAAWHEIGSGDFNGDGHSDILWQNTDGTPMVWLTNGTSAPTVANVGFNPGAAWHVIGAGDFDGDGKADILWQNSNGQAAVWLMDGQTVKSGANVGPNPGANWHVIGTGDFDGDGKADILWQNKNGQAAVWLMDGTNLKAGANVGFNPGPDWHVQGAGDFNGDGKADILWQNANGQAAVWEMNGLNVLGGSNVGFNPGPAWQVHGTGDFNGDGKADIEWQNTDGTAAVWLMDGYNVVAGGNVGFDPGASWHVVPQHHDLV